MLMCYFSLSFYPIDFEPLHDDPQICRFLAMNHIRIPSCFSGFIQDSLDHQVLIDVEPMM